MQKVIHILTMPCYIWCFLLVTLILTGCKKETAPIIVAPIQKIAPSGLKTDIITINGNAILVELASNNNSRAQGLMHRTHLDEDKGMLFLFRKEEILSFHMENCLINIDIAFLKASGEVSTIYTMQKPLPNNESLQYPAADKCKYALELAEGVINKLGLQVGDSVILTKKIKRISPEISLK